MFIFNFIWRCMKAFFDLWVLIADHGRWEFAMGTFWILYPLMHRAAPEHYYLNTALAITFGCFWLIIAKVRYNLYKREKAEKEQATQ